MLTDEEKTRYSRQIQIDGFGEEGQEKLKKARVVVIGAGGLGTPSATYLAAAGVGRIGIVDFDVVEKLLLDTRASAQRICERPAAPAAPKRQARARAAAGARKGSA